MKNEDIDYKVEDKEEKKGYFKGLKKALVQAGEDSESAGLSLVVGGAKMVKEIVNSKPKLNKKSFLKLGATAGAIALIAAIPAASVAIMSVVIVAGAIGAVTTALGLVVETTLVTANHTFDHFKEKYNDKKSKDDVTSSIKEMRKGAYSNASLGIQNKI